MLVWCKDKFCQKRHPKACQFKAKCRRRYRHSKYESVNAEEEINRLKGEIRQLQETNKEKINLLTECEELKTLNINLKQRIQQTAVVFSSSKE